MEWVHVRLPAVDASGKALWPERYSAAKLAEIREQVGEYVWQSLYQQQPYSRGGQLFSGDVQFYDERPGLERPMRTRIGVDLAYSTRAAADYSVAIVLGEVEGVSYLLDVVRMQVRAPEFRAALGALQARHYGAPCLAFIGGQERGILDLFGEAGIHIDGRPATQDKFTRAQPVAAAWNSGRVLVPRAAPWLDAVVSEIVSFTGSGDVHDDVVDALAAAFDAQPSVAQLMARERAHIENERRLAGGGGAMDPRRLQAVRTPAFGSGLGSRFSRRAADDCWASPPRNPEPPRMDGPTNVVVPGPPGTQPTVYQVPQPPSFTGGAHGGGRGWGNNGLGF